MEIKTNDLEVRLEFQSLQQSGTFTDQQLENLFNQVQKVNAIFTDFKAAVEKASEKGHLTPAGVNAVGNQLREKALTELGAIEKQLVGPLDKRIAIESESLSAGLGIGDGPADAIREAELRSILVKMDPLERQVAYLDAANDGSDPLLEAAVERAPKILHLVSDETIAEGRQARVGRLNPSQAKQIEMLTEWRRVTLGYIKRAQRRLREYGSHGVI